MRLDRIAAVDLFSYANRKAYYLDGSDCPVVTITEHYDQFLCFIYKLRISLIGVCRLNCRLNASNISQRALADSRLSEMELRGYGIGLFVK